MMQIYPVYPVLGFEQRLGDDAVEIVCRQDWWARSFLIETDVLGWVAPAGPCELLRRPAPRWSVPIGQTERLL